MKKFISIYMVFVMFGLTAEAIGQEEDTLYDNQDVLETQARQQAEMAQEMADLAREQAKLERMSGMAAAGGGGGYGGMMMEDDHGKMIMTPAPRPGVGSTGMMLPSFEMQQGMALIVPIEPLGGELMGQITEDMHTMSQILYEKIHPDQAQASGVNRYINVIGGFFSTGERAGIAGMYLEGYGMVFVQQVDFPLVPFGEKPAPAEPPAEETDEVWQRTQKKLKGEYEEPAEAQTREYDADQVKALRETVSMSLIHASNIRHLKNGECVVVVIQSLPHRGGFQHMIHGYGTGSVMMKTGGDNAAPEQPSFMVVRAQKKDIDDFASGRVEQKRFLEKVTVISY